MNPYKYSFFFALNRRGQLGRYGYQQTLARLELNKSSAKSKNSETTLRQWQAIMSIVYYFLASLGVISLAFGGLVLWSYCREHNILYLFPKLVTGPALISLAVAFSMLVVFLAVPLGMGFHASSTLKGTEEGLSAKPDGRSLRDSAIFSGGWSVVTIFLIMHSSGIVYILLSIFFGSLLGVFAIGCRLNAEKYKKPVLRVISVIFSAFEIGFSQLLGIMLWHFIVQPKSGLIGVVVGVASIILPTLCFFLGMASKLKQKNLAVYFAFLLYMSMTLSFLAHAPLSDEAAILIGLRIENATRESFKCGNGTQNCIFKNIKPSDSASNEKLPIAIMAVVGDVVYYENETRRTKPSSNEIKN